MTKRLGVALLIEQRAEGDTPSLRPFEQFVCPGVEQEYLLQHAPELPAQQIAPLGKQGGQIGTGPLQVALRKIDTERHLTGMGLDAEMLEQADQVGIGEVVVHHKSGIHRMGDAIQCHIHCIGVTTQIIGPFIESHGVALL